MGPWSRVWPDAASRPWLFRIGDSSVDLERLGAFETVALAVAGSSAMAGEALASCPRGCRAHPLRGGAFVGCHFLQVGEVLAILPTRSWRERQSLCTRFAPWRCDLASA